MRGIIRITALRALCRYRHNGEARVTASRLYRLGTALGVDCTYFLHPEGPESLMPPQVTQAEAFLLRAFRQLLDLPGPVQQEIVRLIQSAARSHVEDQQR
jgi:hypothetical protein